ncbi:diguanylate cyclase domain-containing protein [Marinomonas polaris]|uniref:diguanylate cyclase domain-containing protein n=1 Tax=Marinomonas polaris TaxID=293552 RepID=UPI003F9B0090
MNFPPASDYSAYPSLSTTQVIVRIAAIIMVWEFVIMLGLGILKVDIGLYWLAFLDILLLSMLSTPCIYCWVIRPFTLARDQAITQIHHLAHTDPLTQLANRRGLSLFLEKLIAQTQRHGASGAVLIIDLDGFKVINDIEGHAAGDAVLIEIARRLNDNVRTEDSAGRLGGDEFMVLLTNLDNQEQISRASAMQVANKLCHIIKQPIEFKNKRLHVGASIGIRILGFEKLDTETAIKDADTAMYFAKQAGKSCAVVFTPSLTNT